MSARSLISYERVKVIICHKICNISIRTCYNRSRIPKYFLDMSANGSWLIESTLTSQHDIKSFFDLEIYLSTFNSLKHLKVHLTILTLQDYVIPSKRQYYGLLRSLRASTPSNNHLRPHTIRHGQRNGGTFISPELHLKNFWEKSENLFFRPKNPHFLKVEVGIFSDKKSF